MSATDGSFCPLFHHAVELVGRRWTGAILRVLLHGHHRFSEIRDAVPGLSDRLLSERLKELEAEGIVRRDVYPETPVKIEYHLTPKGEALEEAVRALSHWAELWVTTTGDVPFPEDAVRQELSQSSLLTHPRG